MPIYEYQCPKCSEKFELMRSLSSDDTDIKCPKCGSENPQRTISLFSSGSNSGEICAPSPAGG